MIKIRKDILSYEHYYFYFDDNKLSALDKEIADQLNISINDYRTLMINRFDAKFQPRKNTITFISKITAENALDYINSILLYKKMQF